MRALVIAICLIVLVSGIPAVASAAPSYHVSGTVTSGGAPVQDAVVVAYNVTSNSWAASTLTDADGTYDLYLASGWYDIKASESEKGSNTTRVQVARATTANLTLVVPGGIWGTVDDGSSMLSGAKVALHARINNTVGAEKYWTTTAMDGYYSISNVAPGSYYLTVTESGSSRAVTMQAVAVVSGPAQHVKVSFPVTQIWGRAVEVTGQTTVTLADATVIVSTAANAEVKRGATDQNGQFQMDVRAGTYKVTFVKAGFVNSTREGVVVGDAGLDMGDTILERSNLPGRVEGQLTDKNGIVADATVVLFHGEGDDRVEYTAFTSPPLGEFAFENVEPGLYNLKASKEGYADAYYHSPLQVEAGSTSRTYNFTMEGTMVDAHGSVVDDTGQPIKGATVTLIGGQTVEAVTDSNGNFKISAPAGEYSMEVSINGFQTAYRDGIFLSAVGDNDLDTMTMHQSRLPGQDGFIGDLDLPHSLMILGLMSAVAVMMLAVALRWRSRRSWMGGPPEDGSSP